MSTSSQRCWDMKISNRSDRKKYFVNTESGVSQWGRQDSKDPLPAGWEYCTSKTGEGFYYNHHFNRAQWEKPTESQKLPVPEGFKEKRSRKCQNVYYFDSKTGKTQWEYPIEKESRGYEDSHFELIKDPYKFSKSDTLSEQSFDDESDKVSDDSYSYSDLDTRTEQVLGSKDVDLENGEEEEDYEEEVEREAANKRGFAKESRDLLRAENNARTRAERDAQLDLRAIKRDRADNLARQAQDRAHKRSEYLALSRPELDVQLDLRAIHRERAENEKIKGDAITLESELRNKQMLMKEKDDKIRIEKETRDRLRAENNARTRAERDAQLDLRAIRRERAEKGI